MSAATGAPDRIARDRIAHELQEAIDNLRADLTRVELWADALDGFARPIPEYAASETLSRHLLPPQTRAAGAPDKPSRKAS